MNDLLRAQVYAIIRAAMYVAGTVATSLGHHWPEEATMSEIAGVLSIAIALAWSLVDKSARNIRA